MNQPDNSILYAAVFGGLLLVLSVVLIAARVRALETKLILIGVFMGIAAFVVGSFPVMAFSLGQPVTGPSGIIATSSSAANLMKMGTILILSGVVMNLLTRGERPLPTAGKEERLDVP